MKVAFLIGNGLSVAVWHEFALAALTASFLDDLAPADLTVLQELTPGRLDENFEAALANIESLRDALRTIREVREQIASPDLGSIAQTIAGTGLVGRLDHPYYSYCTHVLTYLAEAWNPQHPAGPRR